MEGLELRWLIDERGVGTLQFRAVTEGMDGYTEFGEWTDVPKEVERK